MQSACRFSRLKVPTISAGILVHPAGRPLNVLGPFFFSELMSIPDGEYDLDLSVLTQDVSDASSVGLRYQFVPPTVDRNQPVKAYEHGRECILEVPLTDTQKPILFEGTVLKTHPEAHNVASQTYFLSYSEGKPVQLNRLGRTLKVSKTRNASKTESKLQLWMSAKKDLPPNNHTAQNVPDSRPRTASKRASKKPPQKLVQKTVQKLAQEPPKPEDLQDVIIDEADFDSLNSGPEDGFPVIDFDDENSLQVNQKKDNVDDDIDDDFKALEDELAQVMGLPQSEESDADDFPALITTTPVIIDEKKPAVDQRRTSRSQSRPMSMREWVHNGVGGSSGPE